MYHDALFREFLSEPSHAIAYTVSHWLARTYPDRVLVEGEACDFPVERFARAHECLIEPVDAVHNQFVSLCSGDGKLETQVRNGWFEVTWRGHSFDLVLMDWDDGVYTRYWILADSRRLAEQFVSAVMLWKPEVDGQLLIFEGGYWQTSETLYRAIRGASFENLVLSGALKRELLEDLTRFFAARELYDTNGIPWKRGILLIGPPGNGKTHAVKALINAIEKPCLYVKSFSSDYHVDSINIRIVFDRARKMAPCLVVMEDLDALLTKANRSFFLNELDGFAENRGVVLLATTNHPEKLDPAILDRPSRFDRKYHFPLPAPAERKAYIGRWNGGLAPNVQLSEPGQERLVELTDGFSFAYLKELFLSALMAWTTRPEPGAMDRVIAEQAIALAEQMKSATSEDVEADEDENS